MDFENNSPAITLQNLLDQYISAEQAQEKMQDSPTCSETDNQQFSSTASPISVNEEEVEKNNAILNILSAASGSQDGDQQHEGTQSDEDDGDLTTEDLLRKINDIPAEGQMGKRKRTRRNPVWLYFILDETDNRAKCKRCSYSTGSAYSTNLKIHLKCHHKPLYQNVLKYENQMDQEVKSKSAKITNDSNVTNPEVVETVNPMLNEFDWLSFLAQSQQPEQMDLQNLLVSPALNTSTHSTPASRRKRQRRHPVWHFFKDVDGENQNVRCTLCTFSTSSMFSTNLKMHLKSHHKEEFIIVMEQEMEQLKKEGGDADEISEDNPSGKKRRRTIAEIQDSIEKCKQSIGKQKINNSLTSEISTMPVLTPVERNVNENVEESSVQQENLKFILSMIQASAPQQSENDLNLNNYLEQSKLRKEALKDLLADYGNDLLTNAKFRTFVFAMDRDYQLATDPEELQ